MGDANLCHPMQLTPHSERQEHWRCRPDRSTRVSPPPLKPAHTTTEEIRKGSLSRIRLTGSGTPPQVPRCSPRLVIRATSVVPEIGPSPVVLRLNCSPSNKLRATPMPIRSTTMTNANRTSVVGRRRGVDVGRGLFSLDIAFLFGISIWQSTLRRS